MKNTYHFEFVVAREMYVETGTSSMCNILSGENNVYHVCLHGVGLFKGPPVMVDGLERLS